MLYKSIHTQIYYVAKCKNKIPWCSMQKVMLASAESWTTNYPAAERPGRYLQQHTCRNAWDRGSEQLEPSWWHEALTRSTFTVFFASPTLASGVWVLSGSICKLQWTSFQVTSITHVLLKNIHLFSDYTQKIAVWQCCNIVVSLWLTSGYCKIWIWNPFGFIWGTRVGT